MAAHLSPAPCRVSKSRILRKAKRESGGKKTHTVVMMGFFFFVNVFKISVQVQGSGHLPSRLVLSAHSSLRHAVATWM